MVDPGGSGTAALIGADHPVSQALPFSGTSMNFGNAASRAGQWYTVFPAAGALLAVGATLHNQKLEETGALGFQALVDADVVTNVVKIVARRERPTHPIMEGTLRRAAVLFLPATPPRLGPWPPWLPVNTAIISGSPM